MIEIDLLFGGKHIRRLRACQCQQEGSKGVRSGIG